MLETDEIVEMLEKGKDEAFIRFYCKKRDSAGDAKSCRDASQHDVVSGRESKLNANGTVCVEHAAFAA